MSSLFNRFLGKNKDSETKQSKKEQNAARANDTIQVLNKQIGQLEKSKAHTNKKIDILTSEAQIALRKKDKRTALHKVKMRKNLQNRITKLDGQIENLELQVLAMDDKLSNANYLEAMSVANDAMKGLVTDEKIDEAQQVKDELEEQLDMLADLNDVMNQPLQYGEPIDDDDLEEELRMLEQEDLVDDAESDYFMYQHMKNANKNKNNKNANKNKNKHKKQKKLVSSTTDETDISATETDFNIENKEDKDSDVQLTKEEEADLKQLELQENVLLSRARQWSSSDNSGTTFDENVKDSVDVDESESESLSDSDSDMEMVTDDENRYKQENKGRMVKETSKQKMNVMMVTSGVRCFDSLHKSAMILCH